MLAAPGMGMLIEKEVVPEEFDGENQYNKYQKSKIAKGSENDEFFSPRVSLLSSSDSSDYPV